MAIDPNIALQVQPLKLRSPFEMAGEAMQIKDLSQRNQANALDLQAKQQEMERAEKLRLLMQRNPNATSADVAAIAGPMAGATYGKSVAEQREAELKTAKARANITTQILQGVDDDASFALAKSALAATLGPEVAAELGDTYDKARVGQIVARGVEVKDWIDAQFKAGDAARAQTRLDAELPGIQADSAKKGTEAEQEAISLAVSKLQAATNQAEWEIALSDAPVAVKRQIPKGFSRAAVSKARQMGMTADQALGAAVAQQNANTSAYSAQTSRMTANQPSFSAKEVLHDGKVIMANFDSKSGRWFDPATGAQIMAPRPAPTAADAKDAEKFKQAGPILTAVAELSERINTLQGVAAKASGAAERQKAKLNLNDDVAEYEALVMGFTPLVARALGHTGVLTEQDVVSVRKLFPTPGDSKSLRDRKVARVNSIIGQLQGGADPTKSAPPAVADALKSLGAGRHTLSNGEVWEKDAAGNLRKVQ